jgi:hypothetical protein
VAGDGKLSLSAADIATPRGKAKGVNPGRLITNTLALPAVLGMRALSGLAAVFGAGGASDVPSAGGNVPAGSGSRKPSNA